MRQRPIAWRARLEAVVTLFAVLMVVLAPDGAA